MKPSGCQKQNLVFKQITPQTERDAGFVRDAAVKYMKRREPAAIKTIRQFVCPRTEAHAPYLSPHIKASLF